MFKINLDICEYQPYLTNAIPQLLKSTESATRSLFNDLMVVKRYSMLNLYNKFDSRDQMQYHAFLRKCIDNNIMQYGNPLPAYCGRLMSCVTTLPAKKSLYIEWWIFGDLSDMSINYNIVADDTPNSGNRIITLNDIKW